MRKLVLASVASAAVLALPSQGAVTVENLSKTKFSGSGRIINAFAGKAAKEGIVVKTSIDGDRQVTKSGKEVEVVDLAEEKIWNYKVNRKGKAGRCKMTTFAERREAMQGLQDLDFGTGENADAMPTDGSELQDYKVTVNVVDTGAEESYAGLTGNVVTLEILVHRPEMTLEEGGGGKIMTTLVVGDQPEGWDESVSWSQRYFDAMGLPEMQFEGLGKLLASSRVLGQAMSEYSDSLDSLDGAILKTDMRMFAAADPRATESGDEDGGDVPTSLGGLGAKIGGNLLKRKRDEASAGLQEVFQTQMTLTAYNTEPDPLLTLPERCTK